MCKHVSVLLILFSFSFANYAQNGGSATELYNEGLKLSKDGNCEEAVIKYKAAIAKKPDYGDAFYEAGRCYNELEDYKNAVTYLTKAKNYNAESAKVYFELAYANANDDKNDEAITNYKKVLELDSLYLDAAKNLGDIYYNDKDYEHATEYYKKYIDGKEDVENIYYYRIGWSYNDIGKYEEAANYLEKYEPEKDEDKAKKWAELGYAHYKNDEYEIAILDYSTALDSKPDYGTAMRGIADCYYDKEDYDNALKYYLQAVETDEENSESCYYHIGWIYNDKENYEDAIDVLQKAVEYDEKDASNREELGYAYYMTDKYDDALTQLNKAIELDENSKLGYYYKGLCYLALNDKENAKQVYEKLKTINEEQAEKLLKKINGE
jgi:tetratricopeptide (TPR) repeat protein